MFVTGKMVITGIVAGVAALFAAGCQETHADHAAALPDKAVMCSKCQVVYVQEPVGKGSPVKYQSSRMECPDCKAAVASYFATGKLEHTCKTCGNDALQICELHR